MMDRYMVKQWHGVLVMRGRRFYVFETGDPQYVLLAQLDPTGQFQTGLQWPVKRTRLSGVHREQ